MHPPRQEPLGQFAERQHAVGKQHRRAALHIRAAKLRLMFGAEGGREHAIRRADAVLTLHEGHGFVQPTGGQHRCLIQHQHPVGSVGSLKRGIRRACAVIGNGLHDGAGRIGDHRRAVARTRIEEHHVAHRAIGGGDHQRTQNVQQVRLTVFGADDDAQHGCHV